MTDQTAARPAAHCPFCGCAETLASSNGEGSHFLCCMECGAEGPPGATPADAVERWNRRFDPAVERAAAFDAALEARLSEWAKRTGRPAGNCTGDVAARVGARETPEGWVLFGSWQALAAFRHYTDGALLDLLRDPLSVQMAMLRGQIGVPDVRSLVHVHGEAAVATWDAGVAALARPAPLCACRDRPAADCPGEWEPGCDLGANAAHVVVAQPAAPVAPAEPAEALRIAGLALIGLAEHGQHCKVFNLDDEGRHCACTCGLNDAIATIAAAGKVPAEPASEPVAWMTHHDEPMLFPTQAEAAQYCEDDERPIALYAAPQPAPARVPLTHELIREARQDAVEVFGAEGRETPQIVRDVIEYMTSWMQVYADKAGTPSMEAPHG